MNEKYNLLYNKYEENFEIFWGFECGEGWYELIETLIQDIENWYKENQPDEWETFKIIQIKEKYGSLRFYVGGTFEEVHDMIDEAEKKSYHICEVCGDYGEIKDIGGKWYKCVCNIHYNEIMEERKRLYEKYKGKK